MYSREKVRAVFDNLVAVAAGRENRAVLGKGEQALDRLQLEPGRQVLGPKGGFGQTGAVDRRHSMGAHVDQDLALVVQQAVTHGRAAASARY